MARTPVLNPEPHYASHPRSNSKVDSYDPRRIGELYEFIKDKINVHTKIKRFVTRIKSAVTISDRKHNALKVVAGTTVTKKVQDIPKKPQNPRSGR